MRIRIEWVAVAGLGVLALGCALDSDVSRQVGARCEAVADCAERCLPPEEDAYPGGFCTLSCDADGDCPGGAVCAEVAGGVCLFGCTGDASCEFLGPGWTCQQVEGRPSGEAMVCLGD